MKQLYVLLIRFVRKILRIIGLKSWLVETKKSNQTAIWFKSLFAIYDLNNMVKLDLPWWSFESIFEVEKFLSSRKNPIVFEWGSGASTVWLARRSSSVISVEHSLDWYCQMQSVVKNYPNIKLVLKQPEDSIGSLNNFGSSVKGYRAKNFKEYVQAIESIDTKFDLIVIDGRARTSCLKAAISRLKQDGLIVFDNSSRARYRKVLNGLQGKIVISEFKGLTVALPYKSTTSLISLDYI